MISMISYTELEVMTTAQLENEDILSDSLEFLGGEPVIDDSKILYGPLVLSLAPKVCHGS